MFHNGKFKLFIFVIFMTGAVSYAQDNAALCQALVEQVLASIAQNCTNLATNQACYAHELVEVVNQPDINTPGQHFALIHPDRIQIRHTIPEINRWGSVALNIEPRDGTGNDSFHALLFGTIALESRILADEVFLQFRTGLEDTSCDNIQPALVLYVPDNRTVEVTINGALLEITGLITMQWTSENSLVATVHTGRMEIIGSGLVQAQQTAAAVIDTGVVLFWSAPRELNTDEMQLGTFVREAVFRLTGTIILSGTAPPSTTSDTEPSDDSTIPLGSSTSCSESPTHTVQAGENIYRIALRYGSTVNAIMTANNISDPTQLSVGQQLVIPCGEDSGQSSLWPTDDTQGSCGESTVHTVQRGENLYRIAAIYGTTADVIAAANGIEDPTIIHAGQQLTIPCSSGTISNNPSSDTGTTPNPPNPNSPDYCQNILDSAPPEGLSEDMVSLYNQYCT